VKKFVATAWTLIVALVLLAGCSSNTNTLTATTIPPVDSTDSGAGAEVEVVDVEPTAVETTSPEPTAVVAEPTLEAEPEALPTPEPDAGEETPEAAVQAAFEGYAESLLTTDAAAASRLVTPSTFAYYDRILDLGIRATSDELLTTIPLSDGMGVLAMRARLGQELLDVADGQELFEIGVDRGLVGGSVDATSLDRIDVNGDEAFGYVQGAPAFRFERIDETWRVDLPYTTAVIDEIETDFLEGIAGPGATREQFFGLVVIGYQTTFAELGQPLQ